MSQRIEVCTSFVSTARIIRKNPVFPEFLIISISTSCTQHRRGLDKWSTTKEKKNDRNNNNNNENKSKNTNNNNDYKGIDRKSVQSAQRTQWVSCGKNKGQSRKGDDDHIGMRKQFTTYSTFMAHGFTRMYVYVYVSIHAFVTHISDTFIHIHL